MTPTDSTLIHYDPEIMDTSKDESSVESGAEPVRGDGTDVKPTKIHFGLLKGKLEIRTTSMRRFLMTCRGRSKGAEPFPRRAGV